MISGSVLGNGEWVLSSNNACTNNICRLDYSGGPAVIGAGVTMRGAGRRVYMFENTINNSDVLVNRGSLRAETPGGYWYVERLQNEGTIRVTNGDYFGAGFFGNVGTLQLGPGGTLELQGSPQFNLPTTIDGATLVLNASGGATTVQPLTLANGIIRLANPASGVPIASTSASSAIYIGATVTPAQLAAMPVSGPAIVRFDGSAFGFSGAARPRRHHVRLHLHRLQLELRPGFDP